MNTYEFITPSDEITFNATSDAVAVMATMLVAQMAFVKRISPTFQDLPGGVALMPDDVFQRDVCSVFFGGDMEAFNQANATDISDALASFAYVSSKERRLFDAAVAAITDPEKLKEFREDHDDKERSSMNAYCKRAWALSVGFKEHYQPQTPTT